MLFCRSINNFVFHHVKHIGFCVKESLFQGILLHYFIQKKSADKAHRILVETYGDHALSETTC